MKALNRILHTLEGIHATAISEGVFQDHCMEYWWSCDCCGPKVFSILCLDNVTELDHPWKEYNFCYKIDSAEERGALQIKYSPAATGG